MELIDKISITNIKNVLTSKGYTFFDDNKSYNLNIIGIRNESLKDVNKFNDYLVLIYRDESLNEIINIYSVTTKPGLYYLKTPMNKLGTSILIPNQYKGAYVIGYHKGEYEALCQFKPVKVVRDNDMDEELDFDKTKFDFGLFGINIHRSNPFGISYDVNKWSAGCQVFSNIKNFNDFMSLCNKSKLMYGNSFTYTLIEEVDLDTAIVKQAGSLLSHTV